MTWRIRVVFRDSNGKLLHAAGCLGDKDGNVYEFATRNECYRAIKSLEKKDFCQYKGLLEPMETLL